MNNQQITKAKSFISFKENTLQEQVFAIDEFKYSSILHQPHANLSTPEKGLIVMTCLTASLAVVLALLSTM